jgi:mono/diheme cytochrome c family protein
VLTRCRTLVALCITLVPVASASARQPLESAFVDKVAPFLERHCISCHGAEKPAADLRFDGPAPDLTDPQVAQKWRMARQAVAQGEMPPEGRPRPSADELLAAMSWIEDAAARAAVATRGGVGRRALRRLTNREYVATLCDLLGLSFPHATGDLAARLPSDALANAFSNDSDSQVTQALLLRRSLDLVEALLAVALPGAGTVTPFRYDIDLRALLAERHRGFMALPEAERTARRGPDFTDLVLAAHENDLAPVSLRVQRGPKVPLAAEHFDPARGLMLEPNPILIGVNRNALTLTLPFVPDGGVLRVRVRAAAVMEHDAAPPVLRLCFGGPDGPGNVAYPVALVTVTATEPREYLLDVPLSLAECDWKSFRRERRWFVQIDNAAAPLAPHPTPENYDSKKRERYLQRNRLLLESLTLELAAAATWPPQSAAVLLAPRDGEADAARAERSLRAFLSRAFRRPVEAGELEAFVRLFRDQRAAGRGFLDAYRTTVAAALVSPQVFYLVETRAAERRPLTAWELASRLSYLVWNTTPDAELLARAAAGTLLEDAELTRQLHRLVADDRGFAFAREFTRQWLDLDAIDHLGPPVTRPARIIDDRDELAAYDKAIRRDLAAEPAHFLLDLMRDDRPVTALVAADHVVVNDRLARFYGVAIPAGPGWRRAAAPDSRRGGLLTQAGCITAATHAQDRGEIKRGVYLVERFLGIDIPTPPGNVDIKPLDVQLAEDKSLQALSPRQHLDKHRTVATCSVCHQRIDPLGFVWDGFDMYGQPKRDRQGQFISGDARGSLPDKTPFADFAEFRRLLAEGAMESRFAVAFSKRLYAYVLGRGLDHGDEAHLEGIRAAAAHDGGGLRAVITAMVLSEPFRSK